MRVCCLRCKIKINAPYPTYQQKIFYKINYTYHINKFSFINDLEDQHIQVFFFLKFTNISLQNIVLLVMHFKHIKPRLKLPYSNTFYTLHFRDFFKINAIFCLWQIVAREVDINNNITLYEHVVPCSYPF